MRTDKLGAANVRHMVGPTPGPWTLSETASRCIIGRAEHGRMGICVMQNTQSEHYAANARLITAAPELLEALQSLRNWIDSDPNAYDGDDDGSLGRVMYSAGAAIAKATSGAEGQVTP